MINTDYNISVRISDYSLPVNSICLRPYSKFLPLVVLSHFSFNDIIDFKNAPFFCCEKSLGELGLKVSRMFICSISDRSDLFPDFPFFIRPSLKLGFYIKISASYK